MPSTITLSDLQAPQLGYARTNLERALWSYLGDEGVTPKSAAGLLLDELLLVVYEQGRRAERAAYSLMREKISTLPDEDETEEITNPHPTA